MPGTGPAAPTALDLPGTAHALERYRKSARRWAVAGAAGLLLWPLLAGFAGGFFLSSLPTIGPLGAVSLLAGGVVRLRARRMRRLLGTRPWTARASVVLPRGTTGAVVVLGGPAPGELLPLTPFTTPSRFALLNDPAGVLWWCGDARTGGVLAPPGGTELVWAGPVRGPRARSVVTRPQVDALRTRPAPHPPQSPRGGAVTGEPAAWTRGAAPGGAGPSAGHRSPRAAS
ncbi:hypothetical protein ACWCXX_10105 [Streptomyces sp. NPDC001732]